MGRKRDLIRWITYDRSDQVDSLAPLLIGCFESREVRLLRIIHNVKPDADVQIPGLAFHYL